MMPWEIMNLDTSANAQNLIIVASSREERHGWLS